MRASMNPLAKLQADINKFLEVYKILSPEGKAQFEAQLAAAVQRVDEKTRKLYYTLLESAKNGQDVEQALERMRKTSEGL